MTWNYRIMKDHQGWGIFEVYYNEDGDPIATTAVPEFGYFETRLELVGAARMMYRARFENTLIYEDGSGFSVLE